MLGIVRSAPGLISCRVKRFRCLTIYLTLNAEAAAGAGTSLELTLLTEDVYQFGQLYFRELQIKVISGGYIYASAPQKTQSTI